MFVFVAKMVEADIEGNLYRFLILFSPNFLVSLHCKPSSITDMSYVPINPLDGTPDWNRNAQTVQTVPIYPVV